MKIYVVTKSELWEDYYDTIGVFKTFEEAKKTIPLTATIWEEDDYYVTYEEDDYLWTIEERELSE